MKKIIFAIFFVFPITIFVLFILGTSISIPEDKKINENICLHFEPSMGTNEHINIFSYYCKSKINWKEILFNSSKEGILDSIGTMECPKMKIKGNKLSLKQDSFCKYFAHNYEEEKLLKYKVNKKGLFIKINTQNIKYNKNGLKFSQNKKEDFSILELDLNKINLSFGGVDINKISDFDKFNKFYAKDFFKNLSQKKLKNKEIIATINGQFFTNLTKKNTALSFPVKSEGKIITNYMDNEIPKRTFVIDEKGDAKILEGYKKDFLENKNHKEVIVGFTPEVSARRGAEIGRTYIGIKSPKNVIFFIAKNKNQKQMNKIISDYGIKKENIIMMDGGPSSQFSYYENNGPGSEREQFYGKWKVPHFFVIYNK